MPKNNLKADWLPTRPLIPADEPPREFPVDALGPVLAPATRDIARLLQASECLVAQTLLTAATTATQGLADVTINGHRHPISNFFITIADPGAGKTPVDKVAMREIYEHEKQLRENREMQIKPAASATESAHLPKKMKGATPHERKKK